MTSNTPAPDAPEIVLSDEQQRSSGFKELAVVVIIAAAFAIFKPDWFRTGAAFIVILGILVFVHEWGHYQFARWAGLKVNRFALGFPPFIYTRYHKGIAYSLGALPIGGMVDIAGLGSEEEMVAEVKGQGTVPVRNTNRPWGQKQFQDVNLGWRFMTLFAGPMMNFIFAIVVAVGLFSLYGAPDMTNAKENSVALVMGGSPAAKAGVQIGDLITSVNGTPTDNFSKIKPIISGSKGAPLSVGILRDGDPLMLKIKPEMETQPRADGKGTEKVPTVGILFTVDPKTITFRRLGFVDSTELAFSSAFGMTAEIGALLKRAVTFQLTSLDKSAVGGPVKIVQSVGQASRSGGYFQLVSLAVSLSINLGLLNLLPFPALDGGRILFLGYELVMRRPVDPRKEGLVHAAGMVALLAFMLFITLRDVIG
ncbi:putative zinc metalloprotease [Abditibacteriota bacterium]|nr:putative zinc metalloprotease [Abditibacteriota bacterium]